MRMTRSRTAAVTAATLVAGALGALGPVLSTTASAIAPGDGPPAPPVSVTAVATPGGVRVSWTPGSGAAATGSFVVDGGTGTCPVVVPGTATSVEVPALPAQGAATFRVRAAGGTGYSTAVAAPAAVAPDPQSGTYLVAGSGQVRHVGSGAPVAATSVAGAVDAQPSVTGRGLLVLARSGAVTALGDATSRGDGRLPRGEPAVALVPTPTGRGYWVVGLRGSSTARGDARPQMRPPARGPLAIVGAASTSRGRGLWWVTSRGSLLRTGDATSLGVPARTTAVRSVVGTRTGDGLWLLRSDGSVTALGAAAPVGVVAPVADPVDLAAEPDGDGWLVLARTGVVAGYRTSVPAGTRLDGAVAVTSALPQRALREVQLLHTTDLHGALDPNGSTKLGGAAATSTMWTADRSRVRATFTVSSGDNVGASPPLSSAFGDLPTVKALSLMGLDVSAFGNHEHDYALPAVNGLIAASSFRWVTANYSTLAPFTSRNATDWAVAPYALVPRNGVTIGVVAANTPATMQVTTPGNLGPIVVRDLLDPDPAKARAAVAQVQGAVDTVRAKGADLVVLLLHEGYEGIASGEPVGRLFTVPPLLRGVDVVLGGHTHLQYAGMPRSLPTAEVPNAGPMYDRLRACVDIVSKRVTGVATEQVPVDSRTVTPDPAVVALLDGYRSRLSEKFDVSIGRVAAVFPNGRSSDPYQMQRNVQTALGALTTDRMRVAFGARVAFLNGGSVRDSLPSTGYTPTRSGLNRPGGGGSPPWDVVVGDSAAVFPFGNQVATFTVSGANLWLAMENSVSGFTLTADGYRNTQGRYAQVSGLRMVFDPSRPVGSRVVSLAFDDGAPVPRDATPVSAASIDYVVSGGDGYTMLGGIGGATLRQTLQSLLGDAITSTAVGGITPLPDPGGRVTMIGG